MSDSQGADEVDTGKHGAARAQAEAAERAELSAEESGDADPAANEARAADLLDEAMRTDPDGLANALSEDGPLMPGDGGTASDEEVASISRTIGTGADAPSRAGITGSGSGADGMGG